MAVIVDQAFVAERLGANDEAGGAIGAKAGDGADNAFRRDPAPAAGSRSAPPSARAS